ncbi:MAG: response regulator transcription factor [Dysgonamonadaceae bacterium]|jgi:DNA-binding NarL/FixJ family response regulator|nr:response regulator transcription factor [Dysgonamonadaceae bacterium]
MKTNDFKLIRVAIVEDDNMVANGFMHLINGSGIALITGLYYNLKSCREGLPKEIPDVLLLDVELRDGDGVDFCAEIIKSYPGLKIIMLTHYKNFNIAKHALHNGASGYLLKNSDPEELFACIEAVSCGEQFLCKEIEDLLIDKKNEEVVSLTDTEKLVLKYIVNGYTQKKIAFELKRDKYTIKTHVRNMFIKLNVNKSTELIKKCHEMKLV